MKNIVITIAFFISASAFSQLYVSSNSYLYVKDRVLFVTQDVNLQSDGVIYLRNQSQLLQGTTGNSTNRGLGKLSVFQEGTSDNFDYNYWCSPIGNASATVGNENFGISMLNRPTTNIASTPTAILPYFNNPDGTSVPLRIASRWIWKFINGTTYSQWIYAGDAGATISAGQGFTMKGTSGTDAIIAEGDAVSNNPGSKQRYDFRGKPNDGNILVNLALNNFTLTGNPYPSAMHVNAFLLDPANTAFSRIAYYYENDKTINSHYVEQYRGGYGTYSPVSLISNGIYVPATFNSYNQDGSLNTIGSSSGINYQRKYAPIGQGFMIFGTSTGTVTLKNSHRIYYKEGALSQLERISSNSENPTDTVSSPVSHIKINTILNNQFTRQVALAFVPEATDSVDSGIDAKNMASDLPTDVYFFLENEPYVIQGISSFGVTKKIPLGIKSGGDSTFKFYLGETVSFDTNQDVFIHDKLDDSYHNIKTGMYEIALSAGVYHDRFEVTFLSQTLGITENTAQNFMVAQNNLLQTLTVLNPKLHTIQTVSLFDITGKKIFFKDKLATTENYTFSTDALAQGIYILKVTADENLQFSQKVIISNLKN
jgi:hypothetical protein